MQPWETLPSLEGIDTSKVCHLFTSTVVIWNETKLLMRLIYKSRNQHKSSAAFRRLLQLQRSLRNLAMLELWLDHHNTKLNSNASKREYVGRLSMGIKLVEKCREDAVRVHLHADWWLQQALFMPLAMSILAISSRLYFYLGLLLPELTDLRNLLLSQLDDKLASKLREEFAIAPVANKVATHVHFASEDEVEQPKRKEKKKKEKARAPVDEIDAIFDTKLI